MNNTDQLAQNYYH